MYAQGVLSTVSSEFYSGRPHSPEGETGKKNGTKYNKEKVFAKAYMMHLGSIGEAESN